MSSSNTKQLEKCRVVGGTLTHPLDVHTLAPHRFETGANPFPFFDVPLFSTLPFVPDFPRKSKESEKPFPIERLIPNRLD